jgi:hypothetical protein
MSYQYKKYIFGSDGRGRAKRLYGLAERRVHAKTAPLPVSTAEVSGLATNQAPYTALLHRSDPVPALSSSVFLSASLHSTTTTHRTQASRLRGPVRLSPPDNQPPTAIPFVLLFCCFVTRYLCACQFQYVNILHRSVSPGPLRSPLEVKRVLPYKSSLSQKNQPSIPY